MKAYSDKQASAFEDELNETLCPKHGPKCHRTKYGASIGCTFHFINGDTFDCRLSNLDHTRDSDNASVTLDGRLI